MRTQLLAAAAAALTISLTGAATASATTFHSSPGAARTQTPCTADQPCKLSFAVDQAFSGDDVALSPGTYDYFGTDPLGVRPGVVLHGAPGARARIEQTAPYRDCDGCSTLELFGGATLRDVDVTQVEGAGAVEVEAAATLERSALRGRSRALTFNDTGTGSSEAREVLAVALDGTAVQANPGGGTRYLENVTAIGQGAAGKGISVVSGSGKDATLDAVNTITRGTAYDVEAYAKPWGTPDGAGIDDVATLRMRYGNYRGGDKANESTSDPAWPNARIEGWDNNLPDDPKFVSATDFHLADGSPAIDKGRASGLNGTLDIDGKARTYGGKPDVGAYEWQPRQDPPPPGDQGNGNGNGDEPQPEQQPDRPHNPNDPPFENGHEFQSPFRGLKLAKQTVTVKKNVVTISADCDPRATANVCAGVLELTNGKVKVGKSRYYAAQGQRAAIKVKLTSNARKLIARKRKLKVVAKQIPDFGIGLATSAPVTVKLAGKPRR